MVPVTRESGPGWFQRESPLHPAAQEVLLDAFAQGWNSPSKLHSPSRKLAILLNQAREILAHSLRVPVTSLEFLGEPNLGFHLGIHGLLGFPISRHTKNENRSRRELFYSSVDRAEIHAIAAGAPKSHELPVDASGICDFSQVPNTHHSIVSWQAINGETGVTQSSHLPIHAQVFADCTASGALIDLPPQWSTALWDASTWAGPSGLGVFAIAPESEYEYPLAHIDHRRVPESYSPALVLSAAVAMEAWINERMKEVARLEMLNRKIRLFVQEQIGDVDIAGDLASSLPDFLSLSFLYVDAERLLSELDKENCYVDSGSACSSMNLEPSHVLSAMGILTQGNIRITLHHGVTEAEVESMLVKLQRAIFEQRATNGL